jgi:GntP family gluconate:H+ symporter
VLIAVNSFFAFKEKEPNTLQKIFAALGEPVIALSAGVLLVLATMRKLPKQKINKLFFEGIEKAGSILIITAAGGAFGAVLAATNIGQHFSKSPDLAGMGIFFPFLLAFILKTAQGSSTVAIITTAAIVLPLLPSLGLDSENGKLLAVLSMGAGSMMISHANDSYFWVIARFSGLNMRPMLKVYSVATIWMGLTTLLVVYILKLYLTP